MTRTTATLAGVPHDGCGYLAEPGSICRKCGQRVAPIEIPRIEVRARQNWAAREQRFPAFTRQTFDEGTAVARATALSEAERELADEP